jgi:class 3 adenylate cyclase
VNRAESHADIRYFERHVVPTMYKNLGDGLMLVWEIPTDMEMSQERILTQSIIEIVESISERFYAKFRELTPADRQYFGAEAAQLHIGCGIAKGHSWRLDFRHAIDYAGSVVNLASRLQSLAKPLGIVIQYDLAPALFDQWIESGVAEPRTVQSISGFGNVKTIVLKRPSTNSTKPSDGSFA